MAQTTSATQQLGIQLIPVNLQMGYSLELFPFQANLVEWLKMMVSNKRLIHQWLWKLNHEEEITLRVRSRNTALTIPLLKSVRVHMANALENATDDGLNVSVGWRAIGITNQRETTVMKLEDKMVGGRTHFVETCGLPISTYFLALKLLWLMKNVGAIKYLLYLKDREKNYMCFED
ncbi:hypothetical protein BRADI_4g23790v3 [Brachypodium distachyon]|uniref:Glycerol kinase n=1 Tax=Brachypodium distachyon TaxID=15368 RepID=I1IMY5_BRADI|nr:hypothetical protein BRADI_4g23790v3 [Brachypodium distachyon]